MPKKYQPSGEGGTHSPPAMLHHLKKPKWLPGGPKMADGVLKGVYQWVFGYSMQLSINKHSFYEKKLRRRKNGKKMGKKKGLLKIVATTSLPAVDRPNADRCNAVLSCH